MLNVKIVAGPERGRPTGGFSIFVRPSVSPSVRQSVRPSVSQSVRHQFVQMCPTQPIYLRPPICLQILDPL